MSRYDDKIKSNLEKIAKLQDEIEKRKAKIINLQTENKQLQAEKDNEFSQTLLKKLAELGINSPEDRVALMSKLEDFALEQEIAKTKQRHKVKIPHLLLIQKLHIKLKSFQQLFLKKKIKIVRLPERHSYDFFIFTVSEFGTNFRNL